MIDSALIFQRTQAGRDEIYQKSHGLTQSERLVLIMIDGVSAYQAVRSKLPVLSDDRFERALKKLRQQELVSEVLLPLAEQPADELESTIIDRFLQQDPLDPVTIILLDPDEYDDMSPVDAVPPTELPPPAATGASMSASILDDLDELAAMVQKEDRVSQPTAFQSSTPAISASVDDATDMAVHVAIPTALSEPAAALPQMALSLHWGYWSVAVGMAFILGYLVARMGNSFCFT